MAKTGRKRVQGNREPNGRRKRMAAIERSDKIMSVVVAQRLARGAKPETAKDPRWGHALGRALLQGKISKRQYAAGEVYTHRAIAYYGTVTGSLPRFPSIIANMAAGMPGGGAEPGEDTIRIIRDKFTEMEDALSDGGLLFDGGKALTRLCIRDADPIGSVEIGIVREALNKVAHRLRLPLD